MLGLAAAVSIAACGGGSGSPGAAASTTSATPTVDPVVACARQLEYWAGERLSNGSDAGYDYQEMGLTSDQADALSALVDRAKQLRQQQGSVPNGWIHDQALAACGPLVAKAPSPDGWR